MSVELTDDQRLVRRGRWTIAALWVAVVVGLIAALLSGLLSDRPSSSSIEVWALVVVGLIFVAEGGWTLWLLLGAPGRASETRLHEAMRLLVLLPGIPLIGLMMASLFWISPHHRTLGSVIQLCAVLGLGALSAAARVVKRRYPALPQDPPRVTNRVMVSSWAGWYADHDDPTVERYWDGMRWTEQTRLRTLPV